MSDINNNPFKSNKEEGVKTGNIFSDPFKTEDVKPIFPGYSTKHEASTKEEVQDSLLTAIAKGIFNFIKNLWEKAKEIIVRAIGMAAFKFGIEFCAMSIKYLIEMMMASKMSPPSIDTPGVVFNSAPGPQGQTVPFATAGVSSARPGLQVNPFGGSSTQNSYNPSPFW